MAVKPQIISRSQAKNEGKTYYFTSKACNRGHVFKRRVANYFCVACEREDAQVYNKKNQEKTRTWNNSPEGKRYLKNQGLMSRYRITVEQYEGMVEAQEGRCAICGRERPLVVDHCHVTGQIRGLLCMTCNIAVGHIENDDILEALQDYLQKWKSDEIRSKQFREKVLPDFVAHHMERVM